MIDEAIATKRQARAARAEELLNNEFLQEAFTTLRKEYTDAWKITHFKNVDGRERLWQAVNIIDKIEDHLKRVVADGRIASKELAQLSHPKR